MSRIIDLTGSQYGRLKVLKREESSIKGNTRWKCICDCGKKIIVNSGWLRSGNTKSCGCYKSDNQALRNLTHGLAESSEYKIWVGMKSRCFNPKASKYMDYGGRGILVCDRWKESFEAFIQDMGKRPSVKHSLDRVNNDGDYDKNNCKWSTQTEQVRNQRKRVKNTSGFTGVAKIRNKWRAFISIGTKKIHLGYFDDIKQAVESRRQGEIKYRGE